MGWMVLLKSREEESGRRVVVGEKQERRSDLACDPASVRLISPRPDSPSRLFSALFAKFSFLKRKVPFILQTSLPEKAERTTLDSSARMKESS